MTRKAIFQDIDGVLNNYDVIKKASWSDDETALLSNLGEDLIARLNKIVEATGAVLVISSTWRKFYSVMQFREAFNAKGFKGKIIDCTPVLDKERGHEIQNFLDEHKDIYEIEKFVILDDDSDMVHLSHRHVKTSMTTGLTDEHVDQAIRMLNEES